MERVSIKLYKMNKKKKLQESVWRYNPLTILPVLTVTKWLLGVGRIE